ncbi:hypothetical protein IFO69_14695 [Echinicola sp. CAU 1574]|uniref:Lipocalin-like domain-containing protein n=1 Tax=Echinicola arenosa TaxID=2774144 RepID=A0ABR9AMH6_9BACT|nr:hypothetical protein [Echinicola arenosa]MBD8490003.1 hypothetical protein [Echinicola arenosa]
MKKLLFTPLLFLLIFNACSEVDPEPEIIIDPTESFLTGEWKLVKSRGSMIDVTIEGEELKRTEIYTFTDDGTFEKYTKDDDYEASGSGSYVLENVPEEMNEGYVGMVSLTFLEGDVIVGNCTSGNEEIETLLISKEGQLVNVYWAPCDGPWLYYEKQ